jgi:hypothetical protein
MPGSKTGLSKSTFTVERHKKVLTQVKKSDVRTPKTGGIKNQHYAKVSLYRNGAKKLAGIGFLPFITGGRLRYCGEP